MKKYSIFVLLLITCRLIHASSPSTFELISNNGSASIYYEGNEKVINTALEMLISDSKLVAKVSIARATEIKHNTIIVGIPENDLNFRKLTDRYQVEYKDLFGKWEAYKIQAVQDEDNSYLFIMGSDPRGTAYGVLELSRQMGVSPWIWWADVVPEKKESIQIISDNKIYSPSVQYRGVFLNDEDWALMPWSTRTFEPTSQKGAIGPATYEKIFELLLRLRSNTIWPAMHECTVPFHLVDGNRDMAEKYGIVLSTSHAEPMMRTNTGKWDNKKYGSFNFTNNSQQVLSYWEERVKELPGTKNIYTIGMRGIHDGRMQGVKTLDDETKVLQNVIKEQREILKRNNPKENIQDIPQQFVPYKEVLAAYDNGLKLPEDVTLVWCDDNHGYIMRLSDSEEQNRPGGGGVYYHISYWGKPHDYLWLGSTQPGLIYTEMKRAWDYNARRIWIINVGDIKPHEYLTEFFLDMAWDINSFSGNKIYAHQRNWIKKVFGNAANDDINYILKEYYHLAGQRKPEHMAWNKVEDRSVQHANPYGLQPVKDSELSPFVFGDEIERRICAYNEIATLSQKVYESEMPEHLKPAYFQLVHYPVLTAAAMNRKILFAQKSRFYAENNPAVARTYAFLATAAYNEIATVDYTYNKELLNGKWELMMDMKPRCLPVFQPPVLPQLPDGECAPLSELPIETKPFDFPENCYLEHDQMIALNASQHTNKLRLEQIESLGHSGSAVRLPTAKKTNVKQPHLEYRITTTSSGKANFRLGTIPIHPANRGEMRCAIAIDNQKPMILSLNAGFLSDKWAENVLRNQALNKLEVYIDGCGEHIIRIYAIDEPIIVDQLMIDFNLERKSYLFPVND